MKKILLMFIVALIALASCTREIDSSDRKNIIRFDNTFIRILETRSADITNENIPSFAVYGWMTKTAGPEVGETTVIFDKTEVVWDPMLDNWSYNGPECYWKINRQFYFFAFAPFSANYTLSEDKKIVTYENTAEEDLVFATHTRNIDAVLDYPSDVSAVPLDFSHLLSRIFFKFYNEVENDSITFAVANVKLSGLPQNATLDIDSMVWSVVGKKSINIFPLFVNDTLGIVANADIEKGSSAATNHFYLIPEIIKLKDYKLAFDVIEYKNGVQVNSEPYHHLVSIPSMTFEMGKNYRFAVRLNGNNVDTSVDANPITFVVDVLPWGEDHEGLIGGFKDK